MIRHLNICISHVFQTSVLLNDETLYSGTPLLVLVQLSCEKFWWPSSRAESPSLNSQKNTLSCVCVLSEVTAFVCICAGSSFAVGVPPDGEEQNQTPHAGRQFESVSRMSCALFVCGSEEI